MLFTQVHQIMARKSLSLSHLANPLESNVNVVITMVTPFVRVRRFGAADENLVSHLVDIKAADID